MTTKTLIVAASALIIVLIFAAAVGVDHRSCERTRTTRQGLQAYIAAGEGRVAVRARTDTGVLLRLDRKALIADIQAVMAEQPASCKGVFP